MNGWELTDIGIGPRAATLAETGSADDRGVPQPPRLDLAALDSMLETMLAANPGALVAALSPTGLFVTVPESLPLSREYIIAGQASAIDLIVPADAKQVIEAWERACSYGVSRTRVHLTSDPTRRVSLLFVDAVHSHGVFVRLIEGASDLQGSSLQTSLPIVPRVAMLRKNERAIILDVDLATSQLLGWSSDEMVGQRTLEFIDPEDHHLAIASWMSMLRGVAGSRHRVRLRHRHRNGAWVWLEVTNQNLLEDQAARCVVTEMVDVSQEMAVQDALRAREHMLRRLTEALPLGIFQCDSGRQIVYRNDRLSTILGWPPEDTVDAQFSRVVPEHLVRLNQALNAVLCEGVDVEVQLDLWRPRRELCHCTLSLRALTEHAGGITGAIGSVADISSDVRARQELLDRATFDGLTGVHNRASTLATLEHTLATAAADGRSGVGVIYLDLDRFKEINDRLGHAAGDAVLVEIARRLIDSFRADGTVGRLGGDEFLVICPNVNDREEVQRIAERVSVVLGESIPLRGEDVTLGLSVGVAWSPPGVRVDADGLIARADGAMYESKRSGRDLAWSTAA